MSADSQDHLRALRVEVCWDGVIATVTMSGGLDYTNAPRLTEQLLDVTAAHPERLALDLDGLLFVDAAGIRAIDRAAGPGRRMPAHPPHPPPIGRKVFHVIGFMGLAGQPGTTARVTWGDFECDLQALGRSPRTVQSYGEALAQLAAFCKDAELLAAPG